jgi:3-deoxy-manno-octulosonate cytidylyltransferase (CMP-KDO synthetase)
MSSTVVIIPSRLQAKRLPNKPLKIINQKEMILHVHNLAMESKVGEVLVTTPDKIIFDLIIKNGGKSFISNNIHETGTDRVFEAFQNFYSNNPQIIINLQGDMPNLDPKDISRIKNYILKGNCDICTLSSNIENSEDIKDKNIVKVITKKSINNANFSEAFDFKREVSREDDKNIYHHIGIYGFTSEALIRYVNLKRSKLELERNLEQMRAMENGMKVHVGFTDSKPLSVDTEKDFLKIKKVMEK